MFSVVRLLETTVAGPYDRVCGIATSLFGLRSGSAMSYPKAP